MARRDGWSPARRVKENMAKRMGCPFVESGVGMTREGFVVCCSQYQTGKLKTTWHTAALRSKKLPTNCCRGCEYGKDVRQYKRYQRDGKHEKASSFLSGMVLPVPVQGSRLGEVYGVVDRHPDPGYVEAVRYLSTRRRPREW